LKITQTHDETRKSHEIPDEYSIHLCYFQEDISPPHLPWKHTFLALEGLIELNVKIIL
jgi:general stress protein 26